MGHLQRIGQLLFSGGAFPLAFAVLAIAIGPITLLPGQPISITLGTASLLTVALAFWALSFLPRLHFLKLSPYFAATALVGLYYLSDVSLRRYSFSQGLFPPQIVLLSCALSCILWRFLGKSVLWLVCVCCPVLAVAGFVRATNGSLLFSDDHPAFLFRIIQLRDNFPFIPFYNPLWNAGVEAREFFASGVLNFFLLFSPGIYLFDPAAVYNALVTILLFVLPLVSAAIIVTLLRIGWLEGVILSILTLTSSLFWYRWALHYGTLGFIVSASLVPLNLALLARLLGSGPRFRLPHAVLSAATVTLMILWSPAILLFLPLGILLLAHLRIYRKNPYAWAAFFLVLFLNVPWIATFYSVSKVGDFVASSSSSRVSIEEKDESDEPAHDLSKFKAVDPKLAGTPVHQQLKDHIRKHALNMNPLILFFGILGLFRIKPRSFALVIRLALLSALTLAVFGPLIRPQLELERMYVVLAYILALPAALLIREGLQGEIPLRVAPWLVALPVGFLALCPLWLWNVAENRTSEHFSVAGPEVSSLVDEIREKANGGRTLFAGFILHELSSGHVAPLAAWTNTPLIASSYQHDSWQYKDVIPLEYRSRGEEGVEEYLSLMNVTTVVTHDRFWRKWFSSRPVLYNQIGKVGRFTLFRRIGFRPDYFLEGEGNVLTQTGDSVTFELRSAQAVVKFRYLPFLEARGCKVEPYQASPSISLVKLVDCKASSPVTLKAKTMAERLLGL